jgi:hypothetical protein
LPLLLLFLLKHRTGIVRTANTARTKIKACPTVGLNGEEGLGLFTLKVSTRTLFNVVVLLLVAKDNEPSANRVTSLNHHMGKGRMRGR